MDTEWENGEHDKNTQEKHWQVKKQKKKREKRKQKCVILNNGNK